MQRKRSRSALSLVAVVALVGAMLLPGVALANGSVAWVGQGSGSESCGKADGELRDAENGWIHWVFTTGGRSSVKNAVLDVDGVEYDPERVVGSIHFYTPFVELDDLVAEVTFDGSLGRGRANLVISDFCPGVPENGDPPIF